jgi:hypothetical protein
LLGHEPRPGQRRRELNLTGSRELHRIVQLGPDVIANELAQAFLVSGGLALDAEQGGDRRRRAPFKPGSLRLNCDLDDSALIEGHLEPGCERDAMVAVADPVGGTQEQDEEVLDDEVVRYLVSRLLAVVADFPCVPLPAKGSGHHMLNSCEGLVRLGLEAIGATPAHAELILAIASVASVDGRAASWVLGLGGAQTRGTGGADG